MITDFAAAQAMNSVSRSELKPVAFSGAYADLSGRPSLAPVATSGAYGDLSGKPSLSAVATSGAYGDLSGTPNLSLAALGAASAAQGAKADTALQVPGSPVAFGALSFDTAYQSLTPAKPAYLTFLLETIYTLTIAGTLADEVELRIGPNNTVATGGGAQEGTVKWSLTGIALTVGLGMADRRALNALLPPGWYFAIRRLAGTRATIAGATAQTL